jgi:hypothetical protein
MTLVASFQVTHNQVHEHPAGPLSDALYTTPDPRLFPLPHPPTRVGVGGGEFDEEGEIGLDPLGPLNRGKLVILNISGGNDDVHVAQSRSQ